MNAVPKERRLPEPPGPYRQGRLFVSPQPAERILSRLGSFDVILVNSSAGKDSMASLDLIAGRAHEQGVLDRVVVGHADLGRVEWPGTVELAGRQAARYGVPFFVVSACEPDLLGRVERRGKWPSPRQRWCTSDLKRGPLRRLMTRLVREHREWGGDKRVRLLNVMGLRAEESPARLRKPAAEVDARASNGLREVTNFLPLHEWSEQEVWARIAASRISDLVHPAYAAGMPRLSCCFCIFAPKAALVSAARQNPGLAREYARVERETGHRFRMDCSMAEVVTTAESDEPVTPVGSWAA